MAQITRETSKFGTLDKHDFLKGLLMSGIGSIIGYLIQALSSSNYIIDLKAMGVGAAVAGLSYISKNWLDGSKTVITVKPDIINEAEGKTEITKSEAIQTIKDVPVDKPKP